MRQATEYLEELCSRHISGQMKVAPEHMVDRVLALMNKPAGREYKKKGSLSGIGEPQPGTGKEMCTW